MIETLIALQTASNGFELGADTIFEVKSSFEIHSHSPERPPAPRREMSKSARWGNRRFLSRS
jgi:hypothetical protein